ERLRAKNREMQALLNASGSADSLALAADVWKNQVKTLVSQAEALMLDVPAEVRAGESFQAFADTVKRFDSMVQDVARVVDTSGMHIAREVRLTEVTQSAIDEVSPLANALGIDIEATLQEDGIPCVVDTEEMQKAIANILRNAIEATGRAGKVSVEVHSDYRNGRAMVEVFDRGPGMPSDVLAQVFKPFFTTRRDRLGLGLTVAREVVRRAGGSIALSANEPRGMVVRIRLPIRRTQVVKESAERQDALGKASEAILHLKRDESEAGTGKATTPSVISEAQS
ncbi:MAG: HAMP domain-containing histidine kinase, partial [Planctomycetes bacterium]|nr:HAMP domain-containing histidine kinase [Planctomycetota bacterium]